RPQLDLAGVVLNRVGSDRHEGMLRDALAIVGVPVLAVLRRDERLALPSRHLGLVQAAETEELDEFLDHAADRLMQSVDQAFLVEISNRFAAPQTADGRAITLPPPGQRIAVARDEAFAFFYTHFAQDWRHAGAELSFFSPLRDERPNDDADVVILPGGYPELHAARLASNERFLEGLRQASSGARVYGECGGYMALGEALIDVDGERHEMAGLLPVVTSFEKRKLNLGYRKGSISKSCPVWADTAFRGHEFHYSQQVSPTSDMPLAVGVVDARGEAVPSVGAVVGNVAGSYLHLICERRDG
ncbi:MAG: cobyrinate a,c-diamide synthase, partial [Pseudomonadota bacterium]